MRWAWFGLVWFDFFLFLDFRFFFFYMQIVISCSSVTDFNLIFWGCLILVTKTVFFFFSGVYQKLQRSAALYLQMAAILFGQGSCVSLPRWVSLCYFLPFPSFLWCFFSISVNGWMDGYCMETIILYIFFASIFFLFSLGSQ